MAGVRTAGTEGRRWMARAEAPSDLDGGGGGMASLEPTADGELEEGEIRAGLRGAELRVGGG